MSHPHPNATFLLSDPAHVLALGFGAGLLRPAPGTWGTLAALPIAWAAYAIAGRWGIGLAACAFFCGGVWAAGRTGRHLGVSDHGSIVIDEIAAFLLVLAAMPGSGSTFWWWASPAFVAFRVFDIFKPWPIGWLDAHVKGGLGVMIDDTAAALLALGALYLAHFFLPTFFSM